MDGLMRKDQNGVSREKDMTFVKENGQMKCLGKTKTMSVSMGCIMGKGQGFVMGKGQGCAKGKGQMCQGKRAGMCKEQGCVKG